MPGAALTFLRTAANYVGTSASGAAVANLAAGAGNATGALFTIAAGALLIEATINSLDRDKRIDEVQLWLQEVVRRQGSLLHAVESIAEQRERHPQISPATARAMLSAMTDETDFTNHPERAQLLGVVERSLQEMPESDRLSLQSLLDGLGILDQKADALLSSTGRIERELAAQSASLASFASREQSPRPDANAIVDENDNARMRADTVRRMLLIFEYAEAERMAREHAPWLDRHANILDPLPHLELLDALLDEAVTRIGIGPANALDELRSPIGRWVRDGQLLLGRVDAASRLRFSSLYARAKGELEGAAKALEMLESRSDPWGVRRRLAVLSDAGRAREAADLVRGQPLQPEWFDRAVEVFVQNGELDEAYRTMDWGREHLSELCRKRAAMLYANTVLKRTAAAWNSKPGPNPPKECGPPMLDAIDRIRVFAEGAFAEPGSLSALDAAIVKVTCGLCDWTNQREQAARLATRLQSRRPLEMFLVEMALRQRIAASEDWPARVRQELPDTFENALYAAALEGNALAHHARAFETAERLARRADTAERRATLFSFLREQAHYVPDFQSNRLPALRAALVDPGSLEYKLDEARRLIDASKLAEAESLLSSSPAEHDPRWLQVRGALRMAQSDETAGLRDLADAATALDHPDFMKSVARRALQRKHWDLAEPLLRRLRELRPDDPTVVWELGMLCHQLGRDAEATSLWVELIRLDPKESAHTINAAAGYVRQGNTDRAIELLRPVCEDGEAPVAAIVGLVELLTAKDRAVEGFQILERHRRRLWDDPTFLGAYWQGAIAAEHEEEAHLAFVQLRMLQEQGVASKNTLVEMSLEDLLKMAEERAQADRTRAQALLSGQMTWLAAAHSRGTPAIQDWSSRTERRRWILEAPWVLAESCIYATNGWGPILEPESKTVRLVPIKASKAGQPVVIDLSAILTLHALGHLDAALRYFGRVVVPSTYLYKMYVDHSRLRLHQPSRRSDHKKVQAALASRRLRVAPSDPPTGPVVDEHYAKASIDNQPYHLTDLVAALRAAGLLDDPGAGRAQRVAHRPSTIKDGRPCLRRGAAITIALSTLSTLRSVGLLDLVLDNFDCELPVEDAAFLQAELAGIELQQSLRDNQQCLWDLLRNDQRIEHADLKENGSPTPNNPEVSVDAVLLAVERKLPLLIDDRFPQNIHVAQSGSAAASFATPQLLDAMLDSGVITAPERTAAYGRLVGWRYRFLTPPLEVLVEWAEQSRTTLPGPALSALADYVHACLRDPGIFAGIERTRPQTSLAVQFERYWEEMVGALAAHVWKDTAWSAEDAVKLTRWAVSRLLPPPPPASSVMLRLISDHGYWPLLLKFVSQLCTLEDEARGEQAVQCMADALGISREELQRQVMEVLHG